MLPKTLVPNHNVFLTNKYTQYYFDIISNARTKDISKDYGYLEKHHIIPDCFFIDNRSKGARPGWLHGNPNDPKNIVLLTCKEHFICHWLLTKMVTGSAVLKMENALQAFRYSNKKQKRILTSAQFARARLAARIMKLGKPSPKKGNTNSLKGRSSPYKWWNNGSEEIRSVDQPVGFFPGRLKGRPNYKNRGKSPQLGMKKKSQIKLSCSHCGRMISKANMVKHERYCTSVDNTPKIYTKDPWPRKPGTIFTWMNGDQFIRSDTCPGENWVRVHGLKGAKTWTNGSLAIRSFDCPGPGWSPKSMEK